jgi:hypothetical protein
MQPAPLVLGLRVAAQRLHARHIAAPDGGIEPHGALRVAHTAEIVDADVAGKAGGKALGIVRGDRQRLAPSRSPESGSGNRPPGGKLSGPWGRGWVAPALGRRAL